MAAPTPGPHRTHPTHAVIPSEWPAQAADLVVETVGKVRDKTTKPAIVAARQLVYGVLVATAGILAFILALILIVRLWANYVPGHVWIIYAIFFGAFSAAGLGLLRNANAPPSDADD